MAIYRVRGKYEEREGAMLDETLREILLSIAEEIASEGDKSTDKKDG